MKKRLLPITILAALGMSVLVGCGGGGGQPTVVDVTGVTLNKTTVDLYKGGTEQLVATVQPANASDKTVTWKSSATGVVTVSEDGLVSAVDVGRATVTVKTNDGGFSASAEVIVTLNMESISITNKDAFEGILPGENKTLSISGTPAFNATTMLNKGFLHLSSSDEEIASITALNVYALKEGTTTITAELFGKTDSFELTVEHKGTNKERFGTDHEGDANDPFTNEDALKAAKWLEANGGFGTDSYYIKGEIGSFYHAPGSRGDGYVSYFLKPAVEGGEKFEVYKTLKKDGSALTDDEIWVNGTAIAYGPFGKYGSQYETTAATFVSCEGNKPAARQTIDSTVANALAYGKTLADGADSYDYYKFDAYVTSKVGDDYFLTASKGEAITDTKVNAIEIYNAKDADVVAKLTKNAKITITMILKNYHGQIENLLAVKAEDIVVLEEGESWVVNYEAVTFAKALEIVKALADGATTDTLYKFEGIVKEVTTAWDDGYKNMSFTMYAEGDNSVNPETMLAFRIAMDDGIDHTKVVAGAKVTVGGNLQNYVNNDAHTYEVKNGKVLAVEGGDIPTETWVKVTEQPTAGQGYKLILDRESSKDNPGLWFVKDELESEAKESGGKDYYIMTSNNSEESANVEVISADGGFKVKVGSRYLKIFVNGDYKNAGLAGSIDDATVLTYDLTNGFGATIEEKFWGLGTRNDKSFTTVGAVDFTSHPDNYKVCLYVSDEEGGGGEDEGVATMQYKGSTTNLVVDDLSGNATKVGLDPSRFEVNTNECGDYKNKIGLNTDGTIRLYSNKADGNGSMLTLAIKGGTITSIKITLGSKGSFENLEVKAGGDAITGNSGEYAIGASLVTMQNVLKGDSNVQIHFTSIVITYELAA